MEHKISLLDVYEYDSVSQVIVHVYMSLVKEATNNCYYCLFTFEGELANSKILNSHNYRA